MEGEGITMKKTSLPLSLAALKGDPLAAELVRRAPEVAKRWDISVARLAVIAMNDAKFFSRLAKGGGGTTRGYVKVVGIFNLDDQAAARAGVFRKRRVGRPKERVELIEEQVQQQRACWREAQRRHRARERERIADTA
jgi:hypothetical protein